MKNNKTLLSLILVVIGTLVAGFLSHGMNMFYNFLILPLIGVIAYIGLKKQWSLVMLGIFLVTGLWQFITMGMDGMFQQKMYLEALSGALTMAIITISLTMVGSAVGGLLTQVFLKTAEGLQRKRILKALSGLAALILILGLASVTNAFIGNPISAKLAANSAQKYIGVHYPELNLEAEQASYNFKFDHYMVRVKSPNSMDTYFAIYLDSFGHVLEDDYEGTVLSGWNTYRRVNEEYEAYVEATIRENLPYEYDMVIGQLDDRDSDHLKYLTRDKKYKVTDLPLKGLVTVYIYSDELSWKNVAQTTRELNQVLEKADIEVAAYTVVLEANRDDQGNKGESIGIYDFPKEKLSSPNLEKDMALFFEDWNKKSK